jgi:transposase
MIGKEESMEIRILSQRQGMSIREIARITGHSRNTVRKFLRSSAEPRYKERGRRPTKLDRYKTFLEERVKAALPHRLPSPVLTREIKALGYQGSERSVRLFLATLYATKEAEPVTRFETEPGKQMQADWCEFRKGKDPLYAFVATLGFSRDAFVMYTTSQRFELLREYHEQAFLYFGGVPREVLYDNMKTVVLERNAFGEGKHRFHPSLWDLAKGEALRVHAAALQAVSRQDEGKDGAVQPLPSVQLLPSIAVSLEASRLESRCSNGKHRGPPMA